MSGAAKGVVLFHTMHDLFRLEKALKGTGVEVELVPVPRHLSSDCGSAMRFSMVDVKAVRAAIDAVALEVQGVHELAE